MIKFKQVYKRFKNQPKNIFENLNLELKPNYIYILRGVNGSENDSY